MPVVTYVDPDSIHTPTSGGIAPASWFTTHEANFRSIVGRVACRIYASTTQDFNPADNKNITLGTVDFNNGMTTSTADTITVPTSYAGKYLLNGCARVVCGSGFSGGFVRLEIRVNGAAVIAQLIDSNSGAYACVSTTTVQSLSVADAVTLALVNGPTFPTDADTDLSLTFPALSAFWLSA